MGPRHLHGLQTRSRTAGSRSQTLEVSGDIAGPSGVWNLDGYCPHPLDSVASLDTEHTQICACTAWSIWLAWDHPWEFEDFPGLVPSYVPSPMSQMESLVSSFPQPQGLSRSDSGRSNPRKKVSLCLWWVHKCVQVLCVQCSSPASPVCSSSFLPRSWVWGVSGHPGRDAQSQEPSRQCMCEGSLIQSFTPWVRRSRSWGDSTMKKVFVLHAIKPGSILSIPLGSPEAARSDS